MLFCVWAGLSASARALEITDFSGQQVERIEVYGNGKVEDEAIMLQMETKEGDVFLEEQIAADIRSIYDLGYFSDVQAFATPSSLPERVIYQIKVEEKPAIVKIAFHGLEELKEKDIENAMETRLYTILNESQINHDIRMIEKKYMEKGYFLAQVSYTLKETSANEVEVHIHVGKLSQVRVGDVSILGNHSFTDVELIQNLMLRPFARWNATFGAKSFFHDEFLKRDTEYLAYFYKNEGFAQVQVSEPLVFLDPDKSHARIQFSLTEGTRYHVGSLKISGDVGAETYTEAYLREQMLLQESELFRYQKFSTDIEKLTDLYGDLGYAYADVDPRVTYDKERALAHIEIVIAKGAKVYFGRLNVIGNTKTRDNVIRREVAEEVFDGGLYSGTKLTQTKKDVGRLGFFEEVKIVRDRDEDIEDRVNMTIQVKEKSTGSIQGSLGYSPSVGESEGVSGSAAYTERNQSGLGWNTEFRGKYARDNSWETSLGFLNPRINDSKWSLGFNVSYKIREIEYATGVNSLENVQKASIRGGRELVENIFANLSLSHTEIFQKGERRDSYLAESREKVGIKNTLLASLSWKDVNNYISPTEGHDLSLRQSLNGGPLQGDYFYYETNLIGQKYIPVSVSESYLTYFRLSSNVSKIWVPEGGRIASADYYRLGYYDLRGYTFDSVGPKDRRAYGPDSVLLDFNMGGDKQVYFQLEYFLPIIEQAGLKGVFFADIGQVFGREDQYHFDMASYKKDIGFGLHWLTPMGPLKFEWAYPYLDDARTFGEGQFIISMGY
ncbi:MAG: outer membrane protein assembly factor BamA [Zetaproteobacteria bacterium]|nr:outer membrane protein assembly factor BamA [Zetaproteobacteria bacterium]